MDAHLYLKYFHLDLFLLTHHQIIGVKYFKDILSDFRGELNAIVSMPTKMSDAQIKEIESMLNNVLKKKVNLDFKFDPSLISGAKLQIGSLMVDDTAKAKFNKILNNL